MKYCSIFCLMTMLIFSSCSHKPSTDSEEGSRTGFSMNFFRNVLEISAKDENVSISPYSAGVALSMLASGAEGETLAELESALNHCRFVREDLGSNDSVIISSANALWMNRNFPAKKTMSNSSPMTLTHIPHLLISHLQGPWTKSTSGAATILTVGYQRHWMNWTPIWLPS